MQERARTLIEIADGIAFLYRKDVQVDDAAAKKHLTQETRPLLLDARGLIERRFDDGVPAVEAAFRALAESKGLGLGKLAQPVRVALTGTTVSPPLFDSIRLLGRDETLRRIDAALEKIK
jgi:glutamyl-tRNA synthetase